MPRPGRAFVQARALDAVAARPCPNGCGHSLGDHRELPAERGVHVVGMEGESVVFEANPDYRALDFHCGVDGCSCVMRPEGS